MSPLIEPHHEQQHGGEEVPQPEEASGPVWVPPAAGRGHAAAGGAALQVRPRPPQSDTALQRPQTLFWGSSDDGSTNEIPLYLMVIHTDRWIITLLIPRGNSGSK